MTHVIAKVFQIVSEKLKIDHYIFSKYLALVEYTLLQVTNAITINVIKFMNWRIFELEYNHTNTMH